MADAMVHHQRLRSLILVLIERLDVSRMWASLLHLKAIDKDNLQRMEAKKTQSEQVLALIAHLERGYPNRLYKFLRACHLTGQTDILDLFGVDAELYMPGTMSSSNNFTYLRSMSETIKEEENVYCAFTEVAQPQGQSPGDTYRAGGVRTWRVGEGGSTITCLCWMTRHQLLVSSGYDRKVWQMTFKADVKSLMSLQLLDKYCGFWVSSMSRCRNSGELALVAWSDQCIYLDIDPDNPKTVNNNLELGKLLLVHGRNSYKRSASLAQFVIHRGLIISTMQAIFSAIFYFASISIFPSILMVGYTTLFTNFPVFSLVLDKDVSAEISMTYPELYKELTKGRSLSFKTFFIWVLISMYQGGIIMYGALLLFESELLHVVAITFTSLILTELLMVGLTIRTWHIFMFLCEILSLAIYITALIVLRDIFDPEFLTSLDFLWKVVVITSVSCIPLYILKYLRKKFSPPSYTKLTG